MARTVTILVALTLVAVQLLSLAAGQPAPADVSPTNLNPSPSSSAASPPPSDDQIGPIFTCLDTDSESAGFSQNLTAFGNLDTLGNLLGQYFNTINMTAGGELLAGFMAAVDLQGISNDYQSLQSILNDDLNALGDSLNTLFADFNASSVANIIDNAPSDSSLQDIAYTALIEFGNTLNVTTVGQFLVNVSSNAQLPRIGGLVDSMLGYVNFTQVGELVATVPSVVNFEQAGAITQQLASSASFRGLNTAVQDLIANVGNTYIACPTQ